MRHSILTATACLLASLALWAAADARSATREALSALATLEADYRAFRDGSDQPWLPQTILYQIEGKEAHVTIETPMWPRESLDSWLARHDAAWAAWRQRYGGPVDAVDDR